MNKTIFNKIVVPAGAILAAGVAKVAVKQLDFVTETLVTKKLRKRQNNKHHKMSTTIIDGSVVQRGDTNG